jgi:hypothetical protein
LIYVTRQQFAHIQNSSWPFDTISNVLEAASKFNVQDTSPELQHEFCALWNQIVRQTQNDHDWKVSKRILKPIRHVYIRLHHDTNSAPTRFSASTSEGNDILDDPYSYLVCNVTGHVHDGSPSIDPVHNAALPPVSRTSLEAPSLPGPAPLHVDESLTPLPPLDNPYPTHQIVDSPRIPLTSPNPATDGAMRDIVASGLITPHPTLETSTSTSPLSSAPRPPDVSLQHNTNLLAPFDPPNLPPLTSITALDNILHTGPSLSLHSPMT